MPQSNELRVFISSTFRDLQEEREHLVKKIFPEIRSLCRERGVTFTEIDLRWGITEEEAEREGIIRICLEEIDRCRPYFIGILGERYGWTPPSSEAECVADTFPVLADAMLQDASITEMEIVHGVLANPTMADHAFFYFRDPEITPAAFVDTDPETARRLRELKERIRVSGFPLRENFASPAELGLWLDEDLRQLVDAEHPESEVLSALEVERRAHGAFAASRRRAYIANPEYAQRFADWLAAPPLTDPPARSLPLVITAASGLGKSSLITHLVDEYRREHPTSFILEHYVGASQSSGSATAIMRHIVEEIRERFAISDEISSKPEELEKSFPNWLYRAEHDVNRLGIEMLIVIDAVNQLDDAGRRLTWLPKTIPAGIRLLVSTTPGECAEHLAKRAWATLVVAPIDDAHTRKQIVHRYLGEFRKSITIQQTRRLVTDAKGSSPLYLRIVSEELRLHGEHETLDAVIDRYVGAVDLLDVFDRVLERFEHDYGQATVERLMSLLWASRSGLSEVELMELAGLSRIDLSRLLFAIDYHFLHRDGLLGFFHDYLRRAVEKRYLLDEAKQRSLHLEIAECFQSGATASIAGNGKVSHRIAEELAYQLHTAGAMERLRECLSTIPIFLGLYSGEALFEVFRYWSSIGEGTDVAGSYRRGLAEWAMEDAAERSQGVRRVSELLQWLGQWSIAIDLEREQLAVAISLGRKSEEASWRRNIGWLLSLRGEYAEALEELNQALTLYTELGDRGGVAMVIGTMGNVYFNRGENDRALECHERTLSIATELGDRRVTSIAIASIGNAYYRLGEYDRALEWYQQQLSTATELGDRRTVSYAIGHMGVVYYHRGEIDRALECYQQQLAIATELGDRRGVSTTIGNMGNLYDRLGEYDRALECYRQQLSICEEMGEQGGVAIAIGNMGSVYSSCGEYDRALECFAEAGRRHRATGFRYGLIYWLAGTTATLLRLLEVTEGEMPTYLLEYLPGTTSEAWRPLALQHARECAVESISISEDLSKPDTTFIGGVLLARVEAAEGHGDVAIVTFEAMLAQATDDEQRAELHYWLWKIDQESRGDSPESKTMNDHRIEALHLYRQLLAKTPNHEYQRRMEELIATSTTEERDARA
jgi:tetratricopeptide (TPR) repeat protein